ncbi:MAG: DUF2148 domain-containing protein [Desulfatiglans sp.]|jgi:uncharacterized ferredoxin-like protein|nr:DUF2148 domain-containing protein [Thermodesulfobacteriota bacterium]MEE4354179.1 DUF2148 domain-containing protein [Desulfatiglans sp.]
MPDIFMTEWPPGSAEQHGKRDNVIEVAKLMANAAFTAPQPGGEPQTECHLVWGRKERDQIAKKMEELSHENPKNKLWKKNFKYEAVMIREHTDAILFIGNHRAADGPWEVGCGSCNGVTGYCGVFDKRSTSLGWIDMTESDSTAMIDGPLCTGRRISAFGHAIASATWIAHRMLVDCRPFMSAGLAGQKLGYCPNSAIVVAVAASAYHKNPYVDIAPEYHLMSEWKAVRAMRQYYSLSRQLGGMLDYKHWDPFLDDESIEADKRKESEKEG